MDFYSLQELQLLKQQFLTGFISIKRNLTRIGEMGFFHLFSANILMQLIAFGGQLVVAGLLTATELGQIRIMQSFLAIGSIVSSFGFNTSTLKLCSEGRASVETFAIYRSAVRYSLFPIVGTLAAFVLLSYTGFLSGDPIVNTWLPVYALMLVPLAFSSLSMSYLQALRKFKPIANGQMATKIPALILLIACTYLFGLVGYVVAIVISGLFTQLWFRDLIRREVPENYEDMAPVKAGMHWYYARYAFLSNLVNQIAINLDLLVLNYLLADRVQIGYYGFATIGILLLRLYTGTIQQIATPYFSALAIDLKKWRDTLGRYQLLLVFSSAGLLILANWLYPWLTRAAFGDKYLDSIPFFRILSLAWFVRALTALPGIALLGLGKMRLNFWTTFINLPITMLSIVWAYQHFGVWAVPWAVVFSALSLTLLVWSGFYLEMRRHT